MCDIDHFKLVNDARGHRAGDEVLQRVAHLSGKCIRASSDWMARYGGEEFLFVVPETGYAGAVVVAEKMRALIASKPLSTGAGEVAVTASFGVASTTATGPDLSLKVETLMAAADECLYRSKKSGRNCVTSCEVAPPELQVAAG
jgi:diguanylate cyclase (GGDEF)-like protein